MVFNDPFDSSIIVKTDNSKDEIRNYFSRIQLEDPLKEALIQKCINDPDFFKNYINEGIIQRMENNGVSCFSKSKENILLWSHYADSHKGICLEFDISKDKDFFTAPHFMDYSEKYLDFNYLKEREEVQKLIRAKYIGWEYEDEIRIIKMKIGYNKFQKDCLVSIIFGCGVDSDNDIIKVIKNIITEQNYPNVQFFKAKILEDNYGFKFIEI